MSTGKFNQTDVELMKRLLDLAFQKGCLCTLAALRKMAKEGMIMDQEKLEGLFKEKKADIDFLELLIDNDIEILNSQS